VAEDLRQLDNWIPEDRWPHVACPVCLDGHLAVKTIEPVVSAHHQRVFDITGIPEDLSGTFHGVMRCAVRSCREAVAIAGDYCVDFDPEGDDRDAGGRYCNFFRLRFATPALKIISIPPNTPKPVVKSIESAAVVIWADANAPANRLRVAIDELLTAFRVPRFQISNGKRLRMSTDHRIKQFSRFEPGAAEALEAVKWIGNQGSHESGLSVTDVLEGAQLMSFALRQLYDKSEEQIQRRIRAVNKPRGLPKKRSK
jgi:hypothetical protein